MNVPKLRSPAWLQERNNDPNGTPCVHDFWSTVDWEPLGDYKVFKKDGAWYALDTRYNSWYGFHSLEVMVDHIIKYGSVDVWA